MWGWFFCTSKDRFGRPTGRHIPDYRHAKRTGRTRPFAVPYQDGRGQEVFVGTSAISYDREGNRISPPTENELKFELVEYQAPCLQCGGAVRFWRHHLKSLRGEM
ncbi:MAG: hypothetical protein A3A30_03440 [Candidatus Terrybacteria bacterium RIFCSPLOWO2_01_FULL_48_14]|nr:MAG: hypothetical protein A3A30_03440 [Candidatus Terrybacteria bacterium RIFCSPLOWO2_01_FULL_48_14]